MPLKLKICSKCRKYTLSETCKSCQPATKTKSAHYKFIQFKTSESKSEENTEK